MVGGALDDLPVGERAAERPATAADAISGFVHLCDDAGLLQSIRGAQASEPRSDDDHTARRSGRTRTLREDPERRRRRAGDRRVPQKPSPRRRPIFRGSLGRRSLNRLQQWCSRHDPLLSPQTPGTKDRPAT